MHFQMDLVRSPNHLLTVSCPPFFFSTNTFHSPSNIGNSSIVCFFLQPFFFCYLKELISLLLQCKCTWHSPPHFLYNFFADKYRFWNSNVWSRNACAFPLPTQFIIFSILRDYQNTLIFLFQIFSYKLQRIVDKWQWRLVVWRARTYQNRFFFTTADGAFWKSFLKLEINGAIYSIDGTNLLPCESAAVVCAPSFTFLLSWIFAGDFVCNWLSCSCIACALPVAFLSFFLVHNTVDIPCTSSCVSWCSAFLASKFVYNGFSCFCWPKSNNCPSPLAFLSLFFVRGFRNRFGRSTSFIWHSSSPVPTNSDVFDNGSHPKHLAKSGNGSSGLGICRIPPSKATV